MSTAAAIRKMLSDGLTIDQALIAIDAIEQAKPRSSGAERQARYRERQKASLVTSRDVTPVTNVTPEAETLPPPASPLFPSPTPLTQNPPIPPTNPAEPSASAPEPHPIAKPKPPDKRGSRLPKDWWPDDELIEFCLTMGLSDDHIAEIVAEFRDYWCSLAGQRGVKLDWRGTFRNQVRRHFGALAKSRSAATGRHGQAGGGRLAAYQRAGSRFPPPDDVPREWPDLLADGGRIVELRRAG